MEVAGRKRTPLIGGNIDPGRSQPDPDLPGIAGLAVIIHFPAYTAELLHVGDRDALGAMNGDGLQFLRAHHRPDPTAPSLAAEIMADTGEFNQVLPAGPDESYLEILPQFPLQGRFRGYTALAPVLLRIP